MNESIKVLKAIERRLEVIQELLAKTPLSDLLQKPRYSCQEVARISKTHGVQGYQHFSIRLGCAEGRITEAYKRANGQWTIPRAAVIRILEEGIPPERRNGRRRSTNRTLED